jgi:hypothetical protein
MTLPSEETAISVGIERLWSAVPTGAGSTE